MLQSAAVRDEISAELGSNIVVTVSRSRPTFTLIDTLESDGQSSFVFTSAGVPTYSFSCTEPVRADCERAIAAYVAKTVEIRRDALTAGLNDLRAVLAQVQRTAPDDSIAAKLAAIDVLIVVTQNGDAEGLPHTAAIVQHKLGLPTHIAAFDISLGCSGYVYGLYAMKGFMEAAGLKNGYMPTDNITHVLGE